MVEGIMDIIKEISTPEVGRILITSIGSVATYYASTETIATYKIHKDLRTKNPKNITITPSFKKQYNKADIDRFQQKEIKEVVEEFVKIIEQNFSENVLTNFYNNINRVKINKNKLIKFSGLGGFYICATNEIKYSNVGSLYHELFHMASAVYDGNSAIEHTGFQQYYKHEKEELDIGMAINEGYTELLAKRYFNHKDYKSIGYIEEYDIAEKLEVVVGRKLMENYYLKADLQGLINELSAYVSTDEVFEFLTYTDFITKHIDDIAIIKTSKIFECITKSYNFIIKTYVTKLKQQLDTNQIDKELFVKKIEEFMNSFYKSQDEERLHKKYDIEGNFNEIIKSIIDLNKTRGNI